MVLQRGREAEREGWSRDMSEPPGFLDLEKQGLICAPSLGSPAAWMFPRPLDVEGPPGAGLRAFSEQLLLLRG